MEIQRKYSNSMSVSLSMSMCMSVSMYVSMSVSISVSVSVYVSLSIKYDATDIFVRHGNYSANCQGPFEVAWKLEGPMT
jgi:hypothetical protein